MLGVVESMSYWAKDSKFFSHLSRVARLPPLLGHDSRIGYSGLVTELQHQPWKVHFSFTPEYCGLLYVHLHNFIFVFSIWKLGLPPLFNNNGYMHVYVRTHTVLDIYITVEFIPCPRCYLSSLSYFWGLGAREGECDAEPSELLYSEFSSSL